MYDKEVKEVLKLLNTTEEGLSEQEVLKRLKKCGSNKLEDKKKKSIFVRFLYQFKDAMILILLIVALFLFIYGFLYSHEYTDMIIILVVVLINAIIGFIEEEKAESILNGLKKYETYTCKVKRSKKVVVVDTSTLVPGDIVLLEAGDMVPADIRIIKSNNLFVDESALTGESMSCLKSEGVLKKKVSISDRCNMLYKGTNITKGKATGIVTETGMDTQLGKIASSIDNANELKTPLELKINQLSKNITMVIFAFIILIFIISIFKKYTYLETIMLCVSVAVAAIPEGLPAVIAITLSGGISSLAKKNTVVKRMNAVETLGATDIICSDKTGTITMNKMVVKESTLYDEKMLNYICGLCNESLITGDKFIGDPTETCLYDYLLKKRIDLVKLKEKNKRVFEIPFDSERKISSTINEIDGKYYLLCKGSLDNLIKKCSYLNNKKLTSKDIKNIKEIEKKYADNALRVLGFAYRKFDKKPGKKEKKSIENNLVFVGLLGIIDPPREKVKESVLMCKKAGITPIMITGDSINTAQAIAKEVGIVTSFNECILGEELDNYDDEEILSLVDKFKVYARVNPEHKLRIVKAFERKNKVVAMTGDGVNDAPAIKNAHVGVGMGISGTDVTKSVSDVVIMDDSFSTIVTAVEEGRRIYNNIRNNIVYSLSSNFAEIFIVLVGLLTNNLILLPIHILFIDLVTDSIPSIGLAFEHKEKNIMNKKPRGINSSLFTPFIRANIIFSFIVESIYILIIFFLALRYSNSNIATTLALLSVVIQEIVYSISCRNLKEYILKQGVFSNKVMNLGIVLVLFIEILVFLTPLGKVLKVIQLPFTLFLTVVLINLTSIIIYEGFKPFLKKYFKD